MKLEYLNRSACIAVALAGFGGVVGCEINTDPTIANTNLDAINRGAARPPSTTEPDAKDAAAESTTSVEPVAPMASMAPVVSPPALDAGTTEAELGPVNGAGLGLPMNDGETDDAPDVDAGSAVDTPTLTDGEGAEPETPESGEGEPGGLPGAPEGVGSGPQPAEEEGEGPPVGEEPTEGEAPSEGPSAGERPGADEDCPEGCEPDESDAGAWQCPASPPPAETRCDPSIHRTCTYGELVCPCLQTEFGTYWGCE